MRTALVLSFAFLVLAAPVARAQDPITITEQDLQKGESWGELEGKEVVLANVKFKDFFRPNVRLVKIPSDKLVLDAEQNRALADNLAGWRTATGTLDKKGRSNVRVVGIARDDSQAGRTLQVLDVTKLPDDIESFKARVAALGAQDVDGRLALAQEARRRADAYAVEELRDWAQKTCEAALDIRRANTPKSEAAKVIELALKYRELAGATGKAISLLGELLQDQALGDSDRERATKLLEQDFVAVQHRGKWVSKEEFKLQMGFVPKRDPQGAIVSWVRRERIELEQIVTKQRELNKTDPNPRKLLGSQYEEAANKGDPIVGMYKQEVVRTKNYGWPQFVDRFSDPKSGGSELSWDQWLMPDGSRFYFMAQGTNWVLIAWKKKDEPWPN